MCTKALGHLSSLAAHPAKWLNRQKQLTVSALNTAVCRGADTSPASAWLSPQVRKVSSVHSGAILQNWIKPDGYPTTYSQEIQFFQCQAWVCAPPRLFTPSSITAFLVVVVVAVVVVVVKKADSSRAFHKPPPASGRCVSGWDFYHLQTLHTPGHSLLTL